MLYSKTKFYKSQPPQLPQQFGGVLSRKPDYHKTPIHFPLPHYNDTVLYFKTIFDKSQPPQYPQHLGASQETGPPQNFTPPYNDVVLYSKTNFNKSQPPRFPQHLGGGAITQTGLPQNSHLHFPPYNNMVLYLKTIFYKHQPPQFPHQLGGGYLTNRTTTKLHLPHDDVVLHSKANFNKSQPLQFPQQNPKIWGLWVTIVAPLIFDQRLKKQNLQSKTNKETKTQGLLVTSLSCYPPYPRPPPLTSSPSPNGDTILKL